MYERILEKLERFKLPIALLFVGLVLMTGGIFASGLTKNSAEDFPKKSLVDSQRMISIDVSGAVSNPGVYQVKEGSRIEEVIKQAEGFTEDANQEYISKYLNMAQKLSDGTKIYIPFTGESITNIQTGGQESGVSKSPRVNINTASQTELEALPGIGPVTASKIISNRPYQDAGELLSKKVVGKSVYDKIKDLLVLY